MILAALSWKQCRFANLWEDGAFWRPEPATELERLGRKWRMACDDFRGVEECHFVCILDLRQAQPKVGLKLAMTLAVAYTVELVVHRARSVAVCRSLKALGFGPDSSIAWRSLA